MSTKSMRWQKPASRQRPRPHSDGSPKAFKMGKMMPDNVERSGKRPRYGRAQDASSGSNRHSLSPPAAGAQAQRETADDLNESQPGSNAPMMSMSPRAVPDMPEGMQDKSNSIPTTTMLDMDYNNPFPDLDYDLDQESMLRSQFNMYKLTAQWQKDLSDNPSTNQESLDWMPTDSGQGYYGIPFMNFSATDVEPITPGTSQVPDISSPSKSTPSANDRFTALLNMYDRVFCIHPVTIDLEVNPFRCSKDTSLGSAHLLHAILALSVHHLGRITGEMHLSKEVITHKEMATELYKNALRGPTVSSMGLALLDTAVILFALDAAQSAFGNWNKQLEQVLRLTEMFGGCEALRQSSRVRAQLAMFIWWDTTVSLLSRMPRTIPASYFHVLREDGEHDPWDFFSLVGCPSTLVAYLTELSDLAAEQEKTRKMTWAKFDPSRVIEIQCEVKAWTDERFVNIREEDADKMQYKRDCYHCAEAWKSAILLYIVQVFHPGGPQREKQTLSYLSRVTLDHVRCCRKTNTVQKQLLLPVFLAGCEASGADSRMQAKDYCTWWNEKSAYGMFSSVAALLELLWARQLINGDDSIFWGDVIDEKVTSASKGKNDIQCLLG
ncbi:hypothetical protein A1O1_07640 [Capronia coronata CBS 617.96]|uniref:Transcription factor domain-containing protein n=1 Tax=Capronia coronata CBS 617.96 TaxID=1182541 RepID=W9XX68_9EURO|nr:uncharacterized protein A1O1_07640 [Capronia coronata CBS 617.96]EXJ81576.1 hypothetical protein A1O1_07640 [Capronia coronata CBS 617.96]